MLNNYLEQLKKVFKAHPKSSVALVGTLIVTIIVVVIFSGSSQLFRGAFKLNLGKELTTVTPIKQLVKKDTPLIDISGEDVDPESNDDNQATTGIVRIDPGELDETLAEIQEENFDPVVTLDPEEPFINRVAENEGISDLLGLGNEPEVADPTPANQIPSASNVAITAANNAKTVGTIVEGTYNYTDIEGDLESGSTFRWLKATSAADFTGATVVATTKTYTLTANDVASYLRFEVTPRNNNGTGQPVISASFGPVVAAATARQTVTNAALSGTAQVEQELTLTFQATDPSKLTVTWYKGTDTGLPVIVAQAVSKYKLSATDVDHFIYATISDSEGVLATTNRLGPVLAKAQTGTATTNPEGIIATEPVVTSQETIVTPLPTQPTVVTVNPPTNGSNSGFSLNSNTSANVLAANHVSGNTGPAAFMIFPTLAGASLALSRRFAKKQK